MPTVLVVEPSQAMRKELRKLEISYEIVESGADLTKKFSGHRGFFDGVIAPINPKPGILRQIGENTYVKLRELPIFAYGNRITTKSQFDHVTSAQIKCFYKVGLGKSLKQWLQHLEEVP